MNIDDVAGEVSVPKAPFAHILKDQFELELRYSGIERDNGFWVPPTPDAIGDAWVRPSIDDSQFQNWIKNKFWRCTEELAEATECLENEITFWRERWDYDADVRHTVEEIIDALHFLAAATVIATDTIGPGLDLAWERIQVPAWLDEEAPETPCPAMACRILFGQIIFHMGLAANTLKNKPWKMTQMPTDRTKFEARMADAWSSFFILFKWLGMSVGDVYNLYHKKREVNKFRQRTNY